MSELKWLDRKAIAAELRPLHGDKRNVLYADGHVGLLDGPSFARELHEPCNEKFLKAFREAGGVVE
jgi:prepilin-type processing-associated H-X9-DG protein